jgi:protein-S-isoprenylcysteine O-methyltransferase Ste14
VIKLVFKTRRETGRAANFVPPELLGRVLRVIWYPTVTAWIVVPLIIAFARKLPDIFVPLYSNLVITWFAVAIAFAALWGTLICWRKMGKSWRMGIDPGERTQLVFTGAYAYVRHPIYALSSLLMLASVAAVPAPLMIVVAVIHLCFLQWEARREERYLEQLHGADYASYLQHVGRFFPKAFRAYAPGS